MVYKYQNEWHVQKINNSALQKLVTNYNNCPLKTTKQALAELYILFPILCQSLTTVFYLSNSNSSRTSKSSAKEKWGHIFSNHPYSVHLSILHKFHLLVLRVFGHSRTFLF
jgi:hypothetical protein